MCSVDFKIEPTIIFVTKQDRCEDGLPIDTWKCPAETGGAQKVQRTHRNKLIPGSAQQRLEEPRRSRGHIETN
jgi:hypothetical protein